MKCGKCGEALSTSGDVAKCGKCSKEYHFQCAGLRETTWRAKGATAKSDWRCPHFCRNYSGENDGLDQAEGSETNVTLADIMAVVKSMQVQLSTLNDSVAFMSKKYDDFIVEFNAEKKLNQQRFTLLETVKKENASLHTDNKNLKEKLNNLEQYTRNRNIEIHGIEEKPKEELGDIMKELAMSLHLPLQTTDVDVIHRLGEKKDKKRRPIIVQFTTRKVRDQWISHRNTGLISKNLVTHSDDARIYINENLTAANKDLFWQTRQKGKDFKIKYCWVKNGKIFARKDENGLAVQIKSTDSIDQSLRNLL